MKAILSIKPKYVAKIMAGEKRYEYRRKIFARSDVTHIVVYSTAPEARVVGEIELLAVVSGSPDEVWERTSEYGGITSAAYYGYFNGTDEAYALKLGSARWFCEPMRLNEYNPSIKRPPQSFQYLR